MQPKSSFQHKWPIIVNFIHYCSEPTNKQTCPPISLKIINPVILLYYHTSFVTVPIHNDVFKRVLSIPCISLTNAFLIPFLCYPYGFSRPNPIQPVFPCPKSYPNPKPESSAQSNTNTRVFYSLSKGKKTEMNPKRNQKLREK